jgi:hypothetical protein
MEENPEINFEKMDRRTLEALLKKDFPTAVKFFNYLITMVNDGSPSLMFINGRLFFRPSHSVVAEPLLGPRFFAILARQDFNRGVEMFSGHLFGLIALGGNKQGQDEAQRLLRMVLKQ